MPGTRPILQAPGERMTGRQIELARHALGLRAGCLVSHRNNFVAAPDTADFEDWSVMEAAGFAKRRDFTTIYGWVLFHLTRAGAEQALMPGDVLDPEDWGTERVTKIA